MSYYIIFSVSEPEKTRMFELGVSWAKNITNSFKKITISRPKKEQHKSTAINWMNSRGSPGN